MVAYDNTSFLVPFATLTGDKTQLHLNADFIFTPVLQGYEGNTHLSGY